MNRFELKIEEMKKKLALLEAKYFKDHYKVWNLRKEIELYEKVQSMSHEEVGKQISYVAGEIAKHKAGYYGSYYTSLNSERKLLKVLTERIQLSKKVKYSESPGSIVEIGCTPEDTNGGFEC